MFSRRGKTFSIAWISRRLNTLLSSSIIEPCSIQDMDDSSLSSASLENVNANAYGSIVGSNENSGMEVCIMRKISYLQQLASYTALVSFCQVYVLSFRSLY